MPGRYPDRRVRRTRARLKEALLELIEEKDYGEITIREIARRADVGRSTFYSHYDSKEDLLFRGFDRWLMSLTETRSEGKADDGAERRADGRGDRRSAPDTRLEPDPGAPTDCDPARDDASGRKASRKLRFSLPLLRHIRGQRRFFLATLVRGGDARLRQRFTSLIAAPIHRELERMEPRSEARDPGGEIWTVGRAHALAGAFLGLAGWWLTEGEKLTVEEVDELFQELVAA